MNRRDFIKSLLAAGVAAKAAPAFAEDFLAGAEDYIAAGVEPAGNGWYRVWKTVRSVQRAKLGPVSMEVKAPAIESAYILPKDVGDNALVEMTTAHNLLPNSEDLEVNGTKPEFALAFPTLEQNVRDQSYTLSCYVQLPSGAVPSADIIGTS